MYRSVNVKLTTDGRGFVRGGKKTVEEISGMAKMTRGELSGKGFVRDSFLTHCTYCMFVKCLLS